MTSGSTEWRMFIAQCDPTERARSSTPLDLVPDKDYKERLMWSWADRMVKAVSNVTVGTVIVLVHVALAERNRRLQPVVPPDRRIVN